ncbi:hypothetical protein Noda2021_00780 [Candidatus Dependentiae bacterium Noda2021]|nr:hypothetical protein Noda2021_00780 [Candidatus Dependentiae bacterium Noda2021]
MKKILIATLVFGTLDTMDNTLRPMNKLILDGKGIDEFMDSMKTTLQTCKKLPADNKAVAFYKDLTGWVESYNNDTYTAYFPLYARTCADDLLQAHIDDQEFNTLYNNARTTNTLEAWNNFRISSYHIGKKIIESHGVKFQEHPSARSYEDFIAANNDISNESKPWLLAGTMVLFYLRQTQRLEFGFCPEIPKK